MVAAHQRHGDADEADATGEAQNQPVMHAHDVVQADQPGERSRDRHGEDDRPAGEMPA